MQQGSLVARTATLILIALILVVPSGVLGQSSPQTNRAQIPFTPLNASVPVSLTLGTTPTTLSPYFWGEDVSARAKMLPNEAAIVNATPSETVVWPGGSTGDTYNPLNNTVVHPATKNQSVKFKAPATSEADFVAWCKSIHCQAIFEVPGEIDNISLAMAIVNYTEKTLDFHPAYWEIGNEPMFWKEWKIPWTEWGVVKNPTSQYITPAEYGMEVHNYTLAMRSVDPSIQIIGIAAAGRPHAHVPTSTWINSTVEDNAGLIAGVAIHIYANGRVGPFNLQDFYGGVEGNWSVVRDVTAARQAVSAALNQTCPSCSPIPVFVTEIGSAISFQGYANFSKNFPGALGVAAMELEGINLGLPNEDLFAAELGTSNSWFNFKGDPRPDYTIYAQMLSHLGNQVYPVSFQVPSGTLYNGGNDSLRSNIVGVATEAPSSSDRSDLFLLNLNLSTNVSLAPRLPGIASTTPTEVWVWSGQQIYTAANKTTWEVPATLQPLPYFFPDGVPSSWTLPAQSAALFEAYPDGGAPATFQESGLPSSARWYLSVNGATLETDASNITAFLPSGTHPLQTTPLYLPLDKTEAKPKSRYAGFPPGSITVASTPLIVPVPFDLQWSLNLTVSPEGAGTILPLVGWANNSVPITLKAVPGKGEAFKRWAGWGLGSLNGTKSTLTIVPKGALREKAVFVTGYSVTFNETGLFNDTNWSVTIRGDTEYSTTPDIEFVQATGNYGFQVGKVPGFKSTPVNSSVNVTNGPVDVPVRFFTTGQVYAVTFVEWYLPSGTPWSVMFDGTKSSTTGSSNVFKVVNGSYEFGLGPVAGYSPSESSGSIIVNGTSVTKVISFTLIPSGEYAIVFNESGLLPGTNWSVTLGGSVGYSTGDSVAFTRPNGTYEYHVSDVSGYLLNPSSGTLDINGSGVTVTLSFVTQGFYDVLFEEGGLPTGSSWSMILGGRTISSSGTTITYVEVNGTYAFSVGAVSGFTASPYLGNVSVKGSSVVVSIGFAPANHALVYFGFLTPNQFYLLVIVAVVCSGIVVGSAISRRGSKR